MIGDNHVLHLKIGEPGVRTHVEASKFWDLCGQLEDLAGSTVALLKGNASPSARADCKLVILEPPQPGCLAFLLSLEISGLVAIAASSALRLDSPTQAYLADLTGPNDLVYFAWKLLFGPFGVIADAGASSPPPPAVDLDDRIVQEVARGLRARLSTQTQAVSQRASVLAARVTMEVDELGPVDLVAAAGRVRPGLIAPHMKAPDEVTMPPGHVMIDNVPTAGEAFKVRIGKEKYNAYRLLAHDRSLLGVWRASSVPTAPKFEIDYVWLDDPNEIIPLEPVPAWAETPTAVILVTGWRQAWQR